MCVTHNPPIISLSFYRYLLTIVLAHAAKPLIACLVSMLQEELSDLEATDLLEGVTIERDELGDVVSTGKRHFSTIVMIAMHQFEDKFRNNMY